MLVNRRTAAEAVAEGVHDALALIHKTRQPRVARKVEPKLLEITARVNKRQRAQIDLQGRAVTALVKDRKSASLQDLVVVGAVVAPVATAVKTPSNKAKPRKAKV